jgi:cholest-4-en-3-one 26-monooxygenase
MTATSIAPVPALWDPDVFVAGPPHEFLAELRRTQPVYWQDMPDEPGFWAVLTHADLTAVAREPVLYSASEGGVVLENLAPDRLEQMRGMLLAMDPPKHVDYRRPLAPSFKARVIGSMEGRIRAICQEINGRAREQRDVDFVHDVATLLPSQVVGELMGLPRDDWDQIQHWAEMNTSGQDPDIVGEDSAGTAEGSAYESGGDGTMHMAMYAMQFAAQRRTEEPRDDLTSLILAGNFGDGPMSDLDFGIFFVQLVTAGNDTTKTMLSSGLLALLQHPDQLAEVRADSSLLPGAVEEILRYENPLHYFRRTTTADTTLHGVDIPAGDKVLMYYTSANRDETVFDDPNTFDIHRSPNPHLSFGIGEHFCLGAHLARLEGRVFFEEVLSTFSDIELTGDPVRVRSNLNAGYKRMPMRLSA